MRYGVSSLWGRRREGIEVILRGTPEEIAALVRATQERQAGESYTPLEIVKEAVQKAIGDTAVT